jgi:hypothetical protein
MTTKDLRAAVERMKTDVDFARRAYEEPDAVLPIEYDLDPSQWQAVHRALVADVEDANEVTGFQLADWGGVAFIHLDELASSGKAPPVIHKVPGRLKWENITLKRGFTDS